LGAAGALGSAGDTGAKGGMSSMISMGGSGMNSHDISMMKEFVDHFYQNPSKMQGHEIPNFVMEYINKYGKNDYERIFHLINAFFGFCGLSLQSLDEQVYSFQDYDFIF
jgi:hypothetical protein